MSDALIKRFKKCGYRIRTITIDNDMWFSNHLMVSKALNADTFLPDHIPGRIKGL